MSLHARKGLAKITALPHCSNMAGGGVDLPVKARRVVMCVVVMGNIKNV